MFNVWSVAVLSIHLYRHHRCPHKEKKVTKGETGKSEYRSRFEVHPDALPSKSCKPPPEIISTDLLLDGTTIHRSDWLFKLLQIALNLSSILKHFVVKKHIG